MKGLARISGSRDRRRTVLLLVVIIPFALAAIWFAPSASALLLGSALVLLYGDRLHQAYILNALVRRLAAADGETKLEVGTGPYGALSHQINRLLQQRRAQQRLLAMLPTPLPTVAARLAELHVPAEGLSVHVVVLAIPIPANLETSPESFKNLSSTALHHAEQYGALLSRQGRVLLLSFGVLGEPLDIALRAAYRAAIDTHTHWPAAANPPPALLLASGTATAYVLPGLGYTLSGGPLPQALSLLETAEPNTLGTTEATYLHLRRLGLIPTPQRLSRVAQRQPNYTIPFD